VVGGKWKSQNVVNVVVANIPRCASHCVMAHRLNYLQPLDMGAGIRLPAKACLFYHRTNELLIKQNTIYVRKATTSIKNTA